MGMIKGFFGRKIWQVFWGVGGGFFSGIQNNLKICCHVILQIEFNQLQTWAHKFVVGFLGWLIFGPGIFWGF